jgi:hypothetical protein
MKLLYRTILLVLLLNNVLQTSLDAGCYIEDGCGRVYTPEEKKQMRINYLRDKYRGEVDEFYKNPDGLENSKKEPPPIKYTYQGILNYDEAKNKCNEMGKRLPTMPELLTLSKNTSSGELRKYHDVFWSVEQANAYNFYAFSFEPYTNASMDRIDSIPLRKNPNELKKNEDQNNKSIHQEAHLRESKVGVICTDITPNSIEEDKIRESYQKFMDQFVHFKIVKGLYNALEYCGSIGLRPISSEEIDKMIRAPLSNKFPNYLYAAYDRHRPNAFNNYEYDTYVSICFRKDEEKK